MQEAKRLLRDDPLQDEGRARCDHTRETVPKESLHRPLASGGSRGKKACDSQEQADHGFVDVRLPLPPYGDFL